MTGVLSVPGPRRAVGREPSDHELVARVRAGDDRAFEVLFARYGSRITAYVRGMVRDHGRAEDITQEVFLSALRRMRETDRAIAFRPWIYEIAKNACIDAHRRARRAQEVSYDSEDSLGAADQGRLVSPRAVIDAIETRASLENLQGALGALSESHVDVLVLRELEGRSYAEIGEQLGMSRAAVESTLFRARKRLEAEYNELVSGERCRQVQAVLESAGGRRPALRDRRRMARHLAWCQACRHQARLAGVEVEVAPRVPLRKKVGGLLPIPAFVREWLARSVLPGQIAGMGDSLLDWGRAVVAAVAVAVAGLGATQVVGGGPIVDARPYAPGPSMYGGGAATAVTPVLSEAYGFIGSSRSPTAGVPAGALPGVGAGTLGALGAPAAGPLAPQAAGQSGAGTTTASSTPGLGHPVNAVGAAAGGASNGLGETAGGTVRNLNSTVNGAVHGATGTVGGAVQGVTGTADNALRGVAQTAGGLVRDVTSNPADLGGAVNNAVRSTTRTVRGTVRDTGQTVQSAVTGTTGTVTGTVRGTSDTVRETVGGATQTATQAVQDVVGGVTKPPATTQAAPAPAPTPAPASAPAPAATQTQPAPAPAQPVRDVVEQTTNALGGLLGGR